MKKANPLAALIPLIPGVINTVASVVKDKRKKKDGELPLTIEEKIEQGISISSARVTQICGGGGLIAFGVSYMDKSPQYGLIIIGLGVALSIGMEWFKSKKEGAN
jgi:hypothetical protein